MWQCRMQAVSGQPRWRLKLVRYTIAASTKKQLEHCGLCNEFPCKTFTDLRDPSLSDEGAKQALHARENELLKRKEIGTEKWLEGKETSEN